MRGDGHGHGHGHGHGQGLIWVLLGALAAELGLVFVPWVGSDLEPTWGFVTVAMAAPALVGVGVVRRSPTALLLLVPVGWGLLAYWMPSAELAPLGALAGLSSLAAYLIAALWWLRSHDPQPTGARVRLDWEAHGREPADRELRSHGSFMPWVAAALVGGPAAGVMIWPEIGRAAAAGFGLLPGLARVGLILLGTLLGLAVASDLVRPRLPRGAKPSRAAIWGLCTVAALAGLLWVRGG